jgi:hypothetical protein
VIMYKGKRRLWTRDDKTIVSCLSAFLMGHQSGARGMPSAFEIASSMVW